VLYWHQPWDAAEHLPEIKAALKWVEPWRGCHAETAVILKGQRYLVGAPKPLYGQERVESHDEVFVVEGPIDYLLLWQWGYPAVATLGSRIKQGRIEFLQGLARVYLVPHRDAAGR
jgi:hypothetical protein